MGSFVTSTQCSKILYFSDIQCIADKHAQRLFPNMVKTAKMPIPSFESNSNGDEILKPELISPNFQRFIRINIPHVKSESSRYRISSYSFRGNYSFLNLVIQRSQYIRPKVTVHKGAETIQGRKLFKGGNYMRKYGMCKLHCISNLPSYA